MANLELNASITTFIADLTRSADDYPELRKQILQAQADIVEPALRGAISAEGLVDTGTLRDSIGRRSSMAGSKVLVGPTGTHHQYVSRSGVGELRNGHLGYIYEYGAQSRGIRARGWASKTVGRIKGQAYAAAKQAHEQFMNNHNL